MGEQTQNEHSVTKNISRRSFLRSAANVAKTVGLVAAASAIPEPLKAAANAIANMMPVHEIVQPKEFSTAQEWADAINKYYHKKGFFHRIAGGNTFDTPLQTPADLKSRFDAWGGTMTVEDPDDSAPLEIPILNSAMFQLQLPITTLECNPALIDQFPAYENFYNRYEFVRTKDGYKAVVTKISEATIAQAPEIELLQEPIEQVAIAAETSSIPENESFTDAVKRIVEEKGNGLNRFSRELAPYTRKYYNKKLVELATADGLYYDNKAAKIYNPNPDIPNLGPILNLEGMNGYTPHALWIQASLHTLLPDGYAGYQINTRAEVTDFVYFIEERFNNTENIIPCVITRPFNFGTYIEYHKMKRLFQDSNRDVNKAKTIVVVSTANVKGEWQLPGKIPKCVVCYTTVRKDENGNLYMPENRSYVVNDDRMFAFPDEITSVALEIIARREENKMKLIKKYIPIKIAGASESSLQTTPFIGAVISRLMETGEMEGFSEELIVNTLFKLCPFTPVKRSEGEVIMLRVPDMNKVAEFFGEELDPLPEAIPKPDQSPKEQTDIHLPSIEKSANNPI